MDEMKLISEYDGKRWYIRHVKTPDGSIKNDCLIRALCEVTGRSYYNVCRKMGVPYEVKGYHRSIPDYVQGVSFDTYHRKFSKLIFKSIDLASDPYDWATIHKEALEGKLPTVEVFARVWSRRVQYSKYKLILHCFDVGNTKYHSVYCKNGYYYDSNDSDKLFVVSVDLFQ